MSGQDRPRSYGNHGEFYAEVYGSHVKDMRPLGSVGATFIEALQSAGDWSDAPTPDLALAWIASRPVRVSCDLGAGRFSCVMRPAEPILIAPGAGAAIEVGGPHRCRVVAVPYRKLLTLAGDAAGNLPADGDFGSLHAGVLSDRVLGATLERLRCETMEAGSHVRLLADAALLHLTALLVRALNGSRPERRRVGLAPWQLRRVTDYIRAHLDRDVSLAELAALAGLSPHHFCRAFADSTGAPPHRWLVERRVERAQEMMAADPHLGLTEVALAVGYGSQSAFGTAFRRVTGTTPSAWRREWLR